MIMKRYRIARARVLYMAARFILKQHKNPVLAAVARMANRLYIRAHGKAALDFLDEEPGRDAQF